MCMSPFAYGKALVTRIFRKICSRCEADSIGPFLTRSKSKLSEVSFFDYLKGFQVGVFFFINLKNAGFHYYGFHFLQRIKYF